MSRPRLAVVTTHPVQYYAPLFRRLAERGEVDPHVFYGWEGAAGAAALDRGFGASFEWDVPLLDGYAHTFVENVSDEPGTHHFRGIDAPDAGARRSRPGAPTPSWCSGGTTARTSRRSAPFSGRIPVLFRGDSTLLDERPGLGGRARSLARRLALRWVYGHVDHALYVGQYNRDYFRAHGLGERQLSWAPHAVDNDRFADPGGDPEAEARDWRRSLGHRRRRPGGRVRRASWRPRRHQTCCSTRSSAARADSTI